MLRGLPGQLRELLGTNDPALERLFPPAYGDDEERNAEYRRLVGEDLMRGRLSSLQVMEETLDAKRLDREQLTAWLGALNDLRLVLGSRLGVTEDMYEEDMSEDDPRAPAFGVYVYLGWLQEQVVAELSSGMDQTPGETA